MPSLRRILASRANGAISRGPVTAEGKKRSSQNAVRHGLLSRCVVLDNESHEGFDSLVAQHIERLQPADGVEFGMVEEMAASYWRLRRAWAIETRLLEDKIDANPGNDELGAIAAAFQCLAESPTLALLHRYETRLHCMYQRALQNLLLLRVAETSRPPSPPPGDEASPSAKTGRKPSAEAPPRTRL